MTWLAVKRQVAPSTQNQALQAILLSYKKVLNLELAWLDDVVRAKRQHRIPVVLSRREVAAVLADINKRARCHTMRHSFAAQRGEKREKRSNHRHADLWTVNSLKINQIQTSFCAVRSL